MLGNEMKNENEKNNDNGNDDDNDGDRRGRASKREIVVSASIDLPFGADVAFDAFSDLPRQPSWSSWLNSVSYVDDNDYNDDDGRKIAIEEEEREKRMTLFDNNSDNNSGTITNVDVEQLRQTKWVMGWKKIRFSWKSKVTSMDRPRSIQWESTSGLKNMGVITFEEKEKVVDSDSYNDNNNDNEPLKQVKTRMTLTLKFITPRVVASLMKRSDKVASFMKTQILRPTLIKFRDIVMVNDLGMDIDRASDSDKKSLEQRE